MLFQCKCIFFSFFIQRLRFFSLPIIAINQPTYLEFDIEPFLISNLNVNTNPGRFLSRHDNFPLRHTIHWSSKNKNRTFPLQLFPPALQRTLLSAGKPKDTFPMPLMSSPKWWMMIRCYMPAIAHARFIAENPHRRRCIFFIATTTVVVSKVTLRCARCGCERPDKSLPFNDVAGA